MQKNLKVKKFIKWKLCFPFYDARGSESWYPPLSHHSLKSPGGVFSHLRKIIKKFFLIISFNSHSPLFILFAYYFLI